MRTEQQSIGLPRLFVFQTEATILYAGNQAAAPAYALILRILMGRTLLSAQRHHR